jgi:hypothetical protein
VEEPVDIRALFMVAPRVELAERLVDDLRDTGVEPGEIRVFAGRPGLMGLPQGVSLSVVRRPVEALWWGLLVGGVLGVAAGVGAWTVAGDVGVAVAATVMVAAAGAVFAVALNARHRRGSLGPLRRMVDVGELVVRAQVPKPRVGQLEDLLKERHPEIQVRGVDPGGSPPFP